MPEMSLMRIDRYVGLVAKLALFIGIIYAGSLASEWLTSRFVPHLTPSTEPTVHRMIMTATVIYLICMMLPFVPGMEIGLALMIVFGPPIVPLVYGATVIALSLSFLVGTVIPQSSIIRGFSALRLERPARLLEEMQALDVSARLPWLLGRAPGRALPWLLRFRYAALMVLFNMPGNAVLGGGGGIAMMSGFCRLFSFPGFVVAVSLAVSPVPLLIFLTGSMPSMLTE
jgi:hypothetical protein